MCVCVHVCACTQQNDRNYVARIIMKRIEYAFHREWSVVSNGILPNTKEKIIKLPTAHWIWKIVQHARRSPPTITLGGDPRGYDRNHVSYGESSK